MGGREGGGGGTRERNEGIREGQNERRVYTDITTIYSRLKFIKHQVKLGTLSE